MVIDFAYTTLSKYALFWIEGLKPRTKQELLEQAGNVKYILFKDKAPDDLDQIAPSLTMLCLHSFSEQDEFQWYAILRLWSSDDSPKGAKMFPNPSVKSTSHLVFKQHQIKTSDIICHVPKYTIRCL